MQFLIIHDDIFSSNISNNNTIEHDNKNDKQDGGMGRELLNRSRSYQYLCSALPGDCNSIGISNSKNNGNNNSMPCTPRYETLHTHTRTHAHTHTHTHTHTNTQTHTHRYTHTDTHTHTHTHNMKHEVSHDI